MRSGRKFAESVRPTALISCPKTQMAEIHNRHGEMGQNLLAPGKGRSGGAEDVYGFWEAVGYQFFGPIVFFCLFEAVVVILDQSNRCKLARGLKPWRWSAGISADKVPKRQSLPSAPDARAAVGWPRTLNPARMFN